MLIRVSPHVIMIINWPSIYRMHLNKTNFYIPITIIWRELDGKVDCFLFRIMHRPQAFLSFDVGLCAKNLSALNIGPFVSSISRPAINNKCISLSYIPTIYFTFWGRLV